MHYLHQHYEISPDSEFGPTIINISRHPEFTLQEAQRIAQAGICLEPAVEVVIPDPNGIVNVSSNWLQNGAFAPNGRHRPACVDLIQAAATKGALVSLLYRTQPAVAYTWDFNYLTQSEKRIAFQRAPPTADFNDAIRYTEFTMCFTRAAMRCSKEQLLRIPANVRGLVWFLSQFGLPWLQYECTGMRMLWAGLPLDTIRHAREPNFGQQQEESLGAIGMDYIEAMREEDYRRCRAFANNAGPPPYY